MITAGMMSSQTGEWETPQDFFDVLDAQYNFTLDPCASHENAKCQRYFTREEDGLAQSWFGETVFMNPPYGREISHWVKKAHEESLRGALVVCLPPARTDTRWFHEYCTKGRITFLRGRLKFGGSDNSAPFPSMVVVFGELPESERQKDAIFLACCVVGRAAMTQLAAAEEVLWYQHCAIECASSATSCGSCGQCSAVKEAKQKFESYRNTYGKGE